MRGEEERVERRLVAILAADVAGYSRLMERDEEGTLTALKDLRREVAEPQIGANSGRIVKTTGDGMLVEFQSVVDAVRCAVTVQRAMAERNAGAPPERRIELRIGINLGDIISDAVQTCEYQGEKVLKFLLNGETRLTSSSSYQVPSQT
jgi:adenylate cyclase